MNYFQQTKTGESSWWSWIVGISMIFVAWFFLSSLVLSPIEHISNSLDPALFEMSDAASNPEAISYRDRLHITMGVSPIAYALMLLTFPAALIGLYIGQKYLHIRPLTALHTAAKRFRYHRAIQGFFLAWLILGAYAFIGKSFGLINIEYVFNGGKFWIYAAVSLLFIPLQSATEEIVFRGYFNQGLTHLLKSKWVAFIISSAAFMFMHSSNPEAIAGEASGTLPIVMSTYFFFGFALCIIVWLDDGLETAIGIHAGNNCFAAIIMNYENSVLPTPSVYLTGSDPIKDAISTFVVLTILVAIIWFWRGGSKNPVLAASNDTPSTADA